MAERIPVAFEGDGAGTAELTWGQREMWRTMRWLDSWMPIPLVRELPEGTTVADVVADLRFVMSRYPSMRTRLDTAGDGMPRQVLAHKGIVDLEVEDVPDGDDPAKAAEAMRERFENAAFDFVRDWPVRMGVVRQCGRAVYQVSVVCHLAVDGFATGRIDADLAGRDPVTGHAPAPPPGTQLLELADWQSSPAGQRQCDRALRYWERQLAALAPGRPAASAHRSVPPYLRLRFESPVISAPPYLRLRFESPAMYLAAQVIAERLQEPFASVLLTLFAAARTRVSGVSPVAVLVVSSNRFRPGLADVVSPLIQPALCVFDLAGLTFADAVGQVRQRSSAAFMNAYYDPVRLDELIDRMAAERGGDIDLRCFYNDRLAFAQKPAGPVPTLDQVRAARERSTAHWLPYQNSQGERLFVHVNAAPEGLVLGVTTEGYVSAADAHACATEMESLAIAAAGDPTIPAG
ncbi:condensation domain-containing protein [Dactylosporangium sp. NPDC048998]|uniref:condensation domain-containing protein n=1 Tax=Dactylosporangium sp. NPDC048998 TaxID=3363976 RepID=UPI00371D3412